MFDWKTFCDLGNDKHLNFECLQTFSRLLSHDYFLTTAFSRLPSANAIINLEMANGLFVVQRLVCTCLHLIWWLRTTRLNNITVCLLYHPLDQEHLFCVFHPLTFSFFCFSLTRKRRKRLVFR